MNNYLDETIDIYNSVATRYAQETAHRASTEQRDRFLSFFQKGAKVLDAGCAAGRDSAYLSANGCKVIGIDLSEKLLEIARIDAPGAKFYSADMRHLSFEKEMFDGIWSCMAIHHIKHEELPAVFAGFFTILKHGGIIYIQVKKGDGEEYIAEPSVPGKKRFFSLFTQKQLKKYCEKAGLTVIDIFDIQKQEVYDNGQKERPCIGCFAKKV